MVKDVDSIPRVGKIPWRKAGQPIQYFCLENLMDRGAWWATVHRVAKSRTWLKWLSWRRKWQLTPVFLPGEYHGQRSLVGYSPQDRRVGHDWSDLAHTDKDDFISALGFLHWDVLPLMFRWLVLSFLSQFKVQTPQRYLPCLTCLTWFSSHLLLNLC